ncbi:MAG: hypothetical protein ACRDT8_13975 [Micromonosporaceae bacterium]
MAVERPDREGHVRVNVDTMGSTARELKNLLGLEDWGGDQSVGFEFGDCYSFWPAQRLSIRADDALKEAWRAVKAIEGTTSRYADALESAATLYGDIDRHSAAAVAKATHEMNKPQDDA